MGSVVEVRSPVDVTQLRARLGHADVVQFSEPLTEAEYRSVAALLVDHPMVPLRVYGFDDDLATLRFLRWFPHVRRFSVASLWHLTDLTPLDQLSADVEFLDIGETRKPLNLAPVAQFRRLRRLRVVEHRRGLPELLHANPGLRDLSLWRLPVDHVLPVIALPHLQALALTLGSLTNSEWLTQIPTLRYLALRQVRKLSDLTPVTRLRALQWLWLETLTVDRLPDFSSSIMLTRANASGCVTSAIRQPSRASPRHHSCGNSWLQRRICQSTRSSPSLVTRHSNGPRSCWAANTATATPMTFCGCHHHVQTRSSPRCTS
ncbi:hypothetical protein [Micromonospora ureilytica]|uniref:hypothetical protein n=1 Tax=Micromonospora ureilytica TaxID=709868 RepID=UPI002E11B436|nr:hypothetical protein OHB55_18720 [Micromonospora ureilytica]